MTDFLAGSLEYDNFIKMPVDATAMKAMLREGLPSTEARAYWWPVLPELDPELSRYWEFPDAVGAAERLANLLKEPLLTSKGDIEHVVSNVSYVLCSTKKLAHADAPSFDTLLRILVHVLKRADVCYYVSCNLLAQGETKYLAQGQRAYASTLFAFREMCDKYFPKTYKVLMGIGALDDKYLGLIFQGFFVELLPPSVVLRIVDAFLHEGVKILYRYGLALLQGYKALIKAGKFTAAQDLWLSVKADAIAVCGADTTQAAPQVLLSKTLGIAEVLPSVDTFLVYRFSKNQPFLLGDQLSGFAYDANRSALDKFRRPIPVSSSTITSLRSGAPSNGVSACSSDNSSSQLEADSSAPASAAAKSEATRTAPLQRRGSVTQLAAASSGASKGALQRTMSHRAGGPPGGAFDNNKDKETKAEKDTAAAWTSPNGKPITVPPSMMHRRTPSDLAKMDMSEILEAPDGGEGGGGDDGGAVLKTLAANEAASGGAASLTGHSSLIVAQASKFCKQSLHLDIDQSKTLAGYLLPATLADGLEIVFATHSHGWDLHTMYTLSHGLSPCLLVVSLLPPFEDTILCGFINTPLVSDGRAGNDNSSLVKGDPHKVVGDHLTFVCALRRSGTPHSSSTCSGSSCKYACAEALRGQPAPQTDRRKSASEDADLAGVMRTIAEATTAAAAAANEGCSGGGNSSGNSSGNGSVLGERQAALRQFCVAAPTHLSFGASHAFGCNALRLSGDLRTCSTGFSDTFDSPPLVQPQDMEANASHDLQVADVELYCGSLGVRRAQMTGAGPFSHKASILGGVGVRDSDLDHVVFDPAAELCAAVSSDSENPDDFAAYCKKGNK